jgi:hypothetical protein
MHQEGVITGWGNYFLFKSRMNVQGQEHLKEGITNRFLHKVLNYDKFCG